jgi:thiamine-monophosphate kinase
MATEKTGRTELSELGEFGLIDHLTKNIELKHKSTVKGVGDDAAVIENGNMLTLVTQDILIEGVHFDLTYTPLKHLGYKAAVVNISDIVAMNGIAKQLVVGIALSNRFSLEAIEQIYEGISQACKVYDVDLVGGDTTSSQSGLFLSITAIGEVEKEKQVYRSTANEGDLVCVTGDLGAAYMGLLLLERERQVYSQDPDMQPDLAGYDYILERQLKPEPRTDIIKLLKEKGVLPTSMIDISDGLGSEILHLCKGSGLGARIYEEKLPIDPATITASAEFKLGTWTAALNGGEDYELLFTIRQEDYDKIKTEPQISVVGHMTDKSDGVHLVTTSESLVEIIAQGWDALLKKGKL